MSAAPMPQTEVTTGAEVAARTIIIRLRLGALGVVQTVSARDALALGEQRGDGAVDADLLHVSKEILKAEELRSISAIDNALRLWLRLKSFPVSFLRGGMYLFSLGEVQMVEEKLAEVKAARDKRIEAFVQAYPGLKEEAKARLGSIYNPADYPGQDEIKAAYTWKREWVMFQTPHTLKTVSEFLYQRESQKLEAQFTEAADEIKLALRAELMNLIDYMADRLRPTGPSDDKKQIRASKVERLVEFLVTFPTRNVTDDDELTALVARLRNMMLGVDVSTLRDNERVREKVRAGVDEVKAALDDLVEDAPSRRIVLPED